MKRRNEWKKALTFAFALAVAGGMLPAAGTGVYAADTADGSAETAETAESPEAAQPEIVDSGTCGEHATYTLNAEGTLIIEGVGAVDAHAFSYGFYDRCSDIKSVLLCEGISELGASSFTSCNSLSTVVFPSTMSKINERVFGGSTLVKDMYLETDPAHLTWDTVSGMSKQANSRLHVPEAMLTLYKEAFSDKDCYIVTDVYGGSCGEQATFTIDSDDRLVIFGKGAIADNAFNTETFAYADKVKEIWIDENITEIGKNAFAGYSKIEQLILPQGLQKIGDGAFRDWASLPKLVIPWTVTYIGDDAFKGCASLRYVDMMFDPEQLTWAGGGSDDFMPDKQTVIRTYVGYDERCLEKNPEINAVISCYGDEGKCGEGANYILDAVGTLYISGTGSVDPGFFTPENYPLADEVTALFVDEVQSIGERAFAGCKNVKKIEIGKSVTSIGKDAFRGMDFVESLFLDSDPDTLQWEDEDTYFQSPAYTKKPCLFTLEEHVDKYRAKYGDQFSDYLYLIDSNDTDGHYAYSLDSNHTLRITTDYASLPDNLFYGYEHADEVERIIIDGYVTEIGANAFRDLTSLKSISFDCRYLEKIGDGAFRNCSSLTAFDCPFYLNTVGKDAFRDCTSLKSAYFYNYVTGIGANAFTGCTAMTDLYLTMHPDKLNWDYSGADAFQPGGKTLCHVRPEFLDRWQQRCGDANVTFADYLDKGTAGSDSTYTLRYTGVLTINGTGAVKERLFGEYVDRFDGWVNEIDVKEGITSIGSEEFQDLVVTKVYLPSTLTEIGDNAFADCFDLEQVFSYADPDKLTIGANNFTGDVLIHVTPSALAKYQERFPDLKFAGDLAEDESVLVKVNTIGQGTIRSTETDGTTLEGTSSGFQLNRNSQESVTLEANAAPGWEFVRWETADERETYSTRRVIKVSALQSLDLIAVFRESKTKLVDDAAITQWAVVDYEKKNGTAVDAEITYRTNDLYEITLTNADGEVVDVYTVNPKTAVGVNKARAEINLPQTGVTSPGALAAAVGACIVTAIGAAGVLGSGVFRRRKNDPDNQ